MQRTKLYFELIGIKSGNSKVGLHRICSNPSNTVEDHLDSTNRSFLDSLKTIAFVHMHLEYSFYLYIDTLYSLSMADFNSIRNN